jgi:sulfite exporter TauE/SafE
MIEAPLIVLGGLLGSSHCVGMCGGFALTVGMGARRLSDNLRRQLLYSLGRVGTYAFFGLCAGSAGLWLQRRTGFLVNLQAVLSIVAGVVLGWQGLRALGWLPRFGARMPGPSACLAGSLLGPFLTAPRSHQVFLAGVVNGFLPCGLVYGYLALASSTASLTDGFLTMLLFGLGTVPVLVLTGMGASLFTLSARRRLFQAAAVCVLLTGLISIARGALALHEGAGLSCPGCA